MTIELLDEWEAPPKRHDWDSVEPERPEVTLSRAQRRTRYRTGEAIRKHGWGPVAEQYVSDLKAVVRRAEKLARDIRVWDRRGYLCEMNSYVEPRWQAIEYHLAELEAAGSVLTEHKQGT